VVKAEPVSFNGTKYWSVTTSDLPSLEENIREYDAVIVASGHYTVPFIPDITGIREWDKQNPGCISHSKFFRRPEDFKDKVNDLSAFRTHISAFSHTCRKYS